MGSGNRFLTESPTTKHTTWVRKLECPCGLPTLADPDKVTDNNLDDLPGC
jgi:hypothetical protein